MSEDSDKKTRMEELRDLILEAKIITGRRQVIGPRLLWEALDVFRWEIDLRDNVSREDVKALTQALNEASLKDTEGEEFRSALMEISNTIFPKIWKNNRGFKDEK